MNDNGPTDIITEILCDLSWAMESGSEYGYRRADDRIEIEEYSEDGTTATVIGHLRFEETP